MSNLEEYVFLNANKIASYEEQINNLQNQISNTVEEDRVKDEDDTSEQVLATVQDFPDKVPR